MSKAIYGVIDGVTHKVTKQYCVLQNFMPVPLPAGYTQAEYIQSSGAQYIDTGFVPNEKSSCEVVMDYVTVSNDNCGLFGAAGSSYNVNAFEGYFQAGRFFLNLGSASTAFSCTVHNGDRLIMKISQKEVSVNIAGASLSATPSAQTFTSPATFVLHTLNRSGRIEYYSASRSYSCKLWDDGTLVRDLVPCINPSGAAGMYDVVNGVFYGNSGTGEFVTGPTAAKGITHEIKKSYAVVNGVSRLFYGDEPITYTGEYSASKVIYDGETCELYTLKKAGMLTLKVDALYWMCGGGGSPTNTYGSHYGGVGGGGGYVKSGSLTAGDYTVTIGAGASSDGKNGGTTKIVGTSTLSATGGKYTGTGGSGGGSGGTSSYATTAPAFGAGRGVSTYPFGLTSLKAHCAGGGGGMAFVKKTASTYAYGPGGDGGTNGGNGGAYKDVIEGGAMTVASGAGGVYGGGRGAGATRSASGNVGTSAAGQDGTFYGAGGGGCTHNYYLVDAGSDDDGISAGVGGTGYQGVVYILIPR